jgi:hypothetical protein
MKKVLTLTLARALVAVASVSWAATSLNSFGNTQKKPPETMNSNLNSARSNVYRVKVTEVDAKDKTFAVEATFSGKNLTVPLPEIGKMVDVTYAQTPSGSMAATATTVKGSKSNSSDRVALGPGLNLVTGKVIRVNETDKTFAVEVTFSDKNLKDPLPEVGKIYDVTYNQPRPGGPLEATTVNNSRSNSY